MRKGFIRVRLSIGFNTFLLMGTFEFPGIGDRCLYAVGGVRDRSRKKDSKAPAAPTVKED